MENCTSHMNVISHDRYPDGELPILIDQVINNILTITYTNGVKKRMFVCNNSIFLSFITSKKCLKFYQKSLHWTDFKFMDGSTKCKPHKMQILLDGSKKKKVSPFENFVTNGKISLVSKSNPLFASIVRKFHFQKLHYNKAINKSDTKDSLNYKHFSNRGKKRKRSSSEVFYYYTHFS